MTEPERDQWQIPTQRAEDLSDGMRDLLDWLIDKELRRWLDDQDESTDTEQ